MYNRLPRDYLKLAGSNFKYKRCNRKELQKDVDRLKKRIQAAILKNQPVLFESVKDTSGSDNTNGLEAVKNMYYDWSNLLSELLYVPGHRDFVNVRRGIKNCLWLQPGSANVVKVKEDEDLRNAKIKYKGSNDKKIYPTGGK